MGGTKCKAYGLHARARGRFDSETAVFHDHASAWPDAHRRRRMKKKVGRRLAVNDVLCAEGASVEVLPETRQAQTPTDPVMRTAGRNAKWNVELLKDGPNAIHGAESALVRSEQIVVVALLKRRWKRAAENALRRFTNEGDRRAQESITGFIQRDRPAVLPQQANENWMGVWLGVHEHPIVIKYDQIEPAQRFLRSVNRYCAGVRSRLKFTVTSSPVRSAPNIATGAWSP